MTVTQRPRAREFCGTMQDYIIDTDASITFSIQYGGKTILEEEYVPDGNNQVRIRRLGHFCELALWGVWCAGENTWQTDAAGTFSFYINGVKDTDSFVMFSRLETRKKADTAGVLSEVTRKVTRPGVPEYASGFHHAGGYIVTGWMADGTEKNTVVSIPDYQSVPLTVDASYRRICTLLEVESLVRYKLDFNGGSIEFLVDPSHYADMRVFRFKNVYDMPETLCCTGGLSVKGANESDTAAMWGVERTFGVKVTDEYTANSGVIYQRSEYKLWHNLLNSQEAELLVDDEWLPIVITGQKLERDFKRSALTTVEFTFRMADPRQNNLLS